jgi:predicted dehydrogenase
VLCEKPMAMSVADCRRMIAACRRNHVQLGIAYYRHYYPVVVKMKTVIDSGRIGDVMLAHMDAAETPLFTKEHPRYWIFEKNAAGGGCLMDFGCHRIEVLIYLLGPVKKATGVTGRVYSDHDVEDTATVAMAFESGANGVVTVLRGGTQERDAVLIQGTRGTIRVNTLNEGRMTVATAKDTRQERIPPSENAHKPLIEAFCQSVLQGRPVAVDGEVGLQVQEVISAVYQH